jgi:hypothetical protein
MRTDRKRVTIQLMEPIEASRNGFKMSCNGVGGGQPINSKTGWPGTRSETRIEPGNTDVFADFSTLFTGAS